MTRNQPAFSPTWGAVLFGARNHAATGGRVVVATILAETHDLMLADLASFQFFDASLVGPRVSYSISSILWRRKGWTASWPRSGAPSNAKHWLLVTESVAFYH
jgi:hypothetical protein